MRKSLTVLLAGSVLCGCLDSGSSGVVTNYESSALPPGSRQQVNRDRMAQRHAVAGPRREGVWIVDIIGPRRRSSVSRESDI